MKYRIRLSILIFIIVFTFGAVLHTGYVSAASSPYISAKSVCMTTGQTYRLKLKNAGSKKIKWSTSDKKIVTVTSSGKLKAKQEGSATITAKYGKKKYKSRITVASSDSRTLIVYFSATGTTREAAEKIQKATGADILQLLPKKNYTSADLDYGDDSTRATKEQRTESARPAMSTVIRNLKQYDTVYLGYPIWWGKEPKIIRTFLEKYSMKGKTVMPFCTSGSSGISGSMSNIRKYAGGAEVKQGRDLTDSSVKAIKKWIKKELN